MLTKILTVIIALGIIFFCFLVCALSIAAQESRCEEEREAREIWERAEEERKKEEMREEILKELDDK